MHKPLNKELAMAPHGAMGFIFPSSSAYANGSQSEDGGDESRPSSWLSSLHLYKEYYLVYIYIYI